MCNTTVGPGTRWSQVQRAGRSTLRLCQPRESRWLANGRRTRFTRPRCNKSWRPEELKSWSLPEFKPSAASIPPADEHSAWATILRWSRMPIAHGTRAHLAHRKSSRTTTMHWTGGSSHREQPARYRFSGRLRYFSEAYRAKRCRVWSKNIMTEPTAPKDKAELLERAGREYAALEQTIGQLSEAQMTTPLDGSWSAKDILAHIAAWQQILLGFHIGGRPFHEAARGIAANYETDDIDTINEALYQRDKNRPLSEVLDAFRRSHQETMTTIEGLSEADLFRAYTPPGRDPSDGGQLINWIAGDTYEHYEEHRATIQRLTAQS